MSSTQSTLAERFPKKASRTGSILSKDHPPDKKPKSDKASVPSSHEFDPTGLVQRCVIIQKDESGFGLTVSGDNPVFVQLVKEDGAAMRAGVQTGDRIIKVNGTLVTHSNHVEVVKLIKSGSYVALTVLGRPPGLPQIPLSDGEGEEGPLFSLTSPHSPGSIGPERSSSSPSPSERKPTPLPVWAMTEEHSRNPTTKLLKEIQDDKKHIPQHQEQLSKPTGTGQDGSLSPRPREGEQEDGGGDLDRPPSWQGDAGMVPPWTNNTTTPVTPSPVPESPCQRETPCHSPKTTPRDSLNSCPSPDAEDTPDLDSQSSVGSPSSRPVAHIIGAEDEDFDTEQEQMNGQCSCFQSIDLLKSRPAHLAAFIHHVVSQFDPAPLLCYLYAELYKQTSSKETRRILMDTFFIDKTASLKVTVPESIIADLERTAHSINAERKRPEPISEDIHRQYVQQLQDTLLPDIQKNLEDFRHKRSMGLTLAEAELARLDTERMRDRVALEKERSCAEHIMSKIEDGVPQGSVLERTAHSINAERKRPEPISEDIHRQYVQQLQDTLLPDIQKNLEDFRHKRSMGLTLAEAELARLDTERMRDRVALEKERSCAEHIMSKIEDVLHPSHFSDTIAELCMTFINICVTVERTAHSINAERKRPEPISEDIHRQYVQQLQDTLLPDIQKNLEDFRHKRSMGLTLAEAELARLDTERMRDRVALEKERSCAEHIMSKIEDVLCPKISKALEPRQRPTKPQLPLSAGEQADGSSPPVRGSQSSEGSDGTTALVTLPPYSIPAAQGTDGISRESETGGTPSSALPRLGDGVIPGDSQDSSSSNTHFDFSPCTLEHLQEEEAETEKTQDTGTPRSDKSRMEPLGSGEVQSEDDQCVEVELEPPNWQTLVSRDVLSTLTPQEIKRQEVINELFYTERAHVRMMKVLENVFYQPLIREAILPPADIKNIFSNLEEIVQLHVSLTEQMTAVRKKNETALIDSIGDDLLSWFSEEEETKIKRAAGTYCSNQPFALELIKSKQKKDQRFNSFIQEAESNRHCRRLQLKDIIPVETQRLTKYPLLLENIAKYTEDPEERSKVKQAGECCRNILTHVNQEVKEAENKQRLEDYQRRLDLSSLKQSENPMIAEFKNLDLTKRKMVHEGPLSWKVNKDKTIELYTLLLEDILVLLQRQDEKLILKCHSKNLAGTAETKHIFSPIIKLSTVMVRSVATDNRSFFVLSMSDNGAQIYELMAQTVSEQKTWQCLITQRADCMKTKLQNIIPLPQTDGEREAVELMNSGVQKLNKDSEPISLVSIQSPEKDGTEVMPTPPCSTNPFETKSDEEKDEEEENSLQDQAEDEEAFVVADTTDRLTFLKQRSRLGIAIDEDEAFELQPLRADEALRTLATLRQLLINHMSSQEDTDRDSERREQQEDAARTGSQQGSEDSTAISSTVENGSERGENRGENAQELPSGDTGFFETSEDCVSAGSYMVLEVYGGSGESSTDDDVQGSSGEPVAGGDSGIDLKKLLSSSSQSSGGPNLNRRIMTHIRLLQANLQHLKDTEIKYNQLRQGLSEETATDTEENKDKSLMSVY
ncbi:rho guanine nucleotide exchange factor 12-like [Sinocyclocheilus grahami]|uniref:rho guanine nucleotide exchange factor 12-like n=1 Tax=Sinocyclocheilus grahami TaxID=75366 RepID=UPI0007AD02A2|nr:PREDICTED: rho guanine nucleotide exchange factor 12-like [Sinocyclocheilus grahami]